MSNPNAWAPIVRKFQYGRVAWVMWSEDGGLPPSSLSVKFDEEYKEIRRRIGGTKNVIPEISFQRKNIKNIGIAPMIVTRITIRILQLFFIKVAEYQFISSQSFFRSNLTECRTLANLSTCLLPQLQFTLSWESCLAPDNQAHYALTGPTSQIS